jgi:uncharacterized protein (TIGR01619 family)
MGHFKHPRSDGLSSAEEFDTLINIEDKLEPVIEKWCNAIYAGRITTDGRREFYFYGSQTEGFEEVVQQTMSAFGEYKFVCGKQQDPHWSQYLNLLYPSGENLQRITNRDVFESLRKNGDALKEDRDIHHWSYFKTHADRSKFWAMAQNLGYRLESESVEVGDKESFGICIFRMQKIDANAVDDAVIELYRATMECNGSYNGWESPVIKAAN